MSSKICIFAGNYGQARLHAIQCKMLQDEWFFLDEINKLRGLKDLTVRRVGTYYMRKDVEEIESALKGFDIEKENHE